MNQLVDESVRKKQTRKAAIASVVGTSIEWYDFFIYGTMSALVFPQLFFPENDPLTGILLSFSVFFIGFLARPIGAAIFGYYGDRIGRKATLVTSLLLMGISSMLIGLLPTYEHIGIFASFILVFLRFMQGIGVGGEWGGSVVLATEWSSNKRRGLMGSMTQLGVPIGLIASTVTISACLAFFGDSFNTWGWRVPFIISIALVAVGLYIRLGIIESPNFAKMKKENKLEKNPVSAVLKQHPKTIALCALAGLGFQIPFYIFSTFIISYGTESLGLEREFIVNALLILPIVELFAIPIFAHLSDKIGRKKMYIWGCIVTLAYSFPFFWIIDQATTGMVILGIGLSIIGPAMAYAPQAALLAENFPVHLRFSGASFGYQFTSIIGGGLAPMICVYLLSKFGSTTPISIYMVLSCVISILAVSKLKEYAGKGLEETQTEVSFEENERSIRA